MRGAVAAGSRATADAALEMFERGGNAVDAAVAACFATAAGEPALTSLAGGGVMLHRDGDTGGVTACDFFANAPGLGAPGEPPEEFYPVELDFGPARQRFQVGAGSAGVPGMIPGLFTALDRWGNLTPAEVVLPTCRFLREGVPLDPWQAATIDLLRPILSGDPAVSSVFLPGGETPSPGSPFRLPALADFLERLTRGDWQGVYQREFAEAVVARFGLGAGGRITREDLGAYQVVFRNPIEEGYRQAQVWLNPPPSAGGWMVALMLDLLGTLSANDLTSAHEIGRTRSLATAMKIADEARIACGPKSLSDPAPWRTRFHEALAHPLETGPEPDRAPPSTTHVSTLDTEGNAVAVTFTYGEGCGRFVGDTGIIMNNLMGEADLFPRGFHRWPTGERLSTMMCPTLVEHDSTLTVLGTGGANRIRSAIFQTVAALVDFREDAATAVRRPRIHFEAGVLNAEVFGDLERPTLDVLAPREVVVFDRPNLFFGGVNAVERMHDGRFRGIGDPRRSGVFKTVERVPHPTGSGEAPVPPRAGPGTQY